MEHKDYLTRLTELSSKISELPKGYISKKTVSGNVYFYHQWTEGGVKQSRYLHDDEVEVLSTQIEERKKLQAELKDVKAEMTRQPKLRQTDEQGNEVTHMNCTLMHKRIAVAELELDNDTGFIQKIGTVYAPEHLPLGIPIRRGITDRKALNEWWTDRSIPASRSGVREALETLDITSTRMLLIKCYGLSLSDQYWICPEGSGLTWEKVNFFNNGFSDDIGNVLFGSNKKPSNPLDFSSPDNTSDGNLKKRWKIIDGKLIADLAGLFTSRTEHHPLPKAEVSEETLCGYRRFVEERFKTEPEALSVTRICELTSMVGMTVHRLIANGILYGTKVQGKTFCSKSTLIDYLASEDTFRNPTCEGCKELVRTFKRRKSDDTYNEQRRERRKREREKKGSGT